MQEIWKDIKDFENLYEVSTLGKVRNKSTKYELKQFVSLKGYLTLGLFKEGKNYPKRVHRLVAENFIDNPENKETINHIDCDKLNNKVSNLEWNTWTENMTHAKTNFLRPNGSNHTSAKLKEEDVLEIINLRSLGKLVKEIAEMYNLSTSHTSRISRGIYWNKLNQNNKEYRKKVTKQKQ